MNVRVACARILSAILRREASLNTLFPVYAAQVPERDVNLLQELCYGTLRHYPALAAIAAKLVPKPMKAKDMLQKFSDTLLTHALTVADKLTNEIFTRLTQDVQKEYLFHGA